MLEFNAFLVNGADNGHALGGRIGFPVADIMVIGGSMYTQTSDNDSSATPQVFGVDLQSSFGPASFRFEFQQASAALDGDFNSFNAETEHSGYYGQLDVEMDDLLGLPIFLIGRYDSWEGIQGMDVDESGLDDAATRITAGMGYVIREGFEVRFELLTDSWESGDAESSILIQTLVAF